MTTEENGVETLDNPAKCLNTMAGDAQENLKSDNSNVSKMTNGVNDHEINDLIEPSCDLSVNSDDLVKIDEPVDQPNIFNTSLNDNNNTFIDDPANQSNAYYSAVDDTTNFSDNTMITASEGTEENVSSRSESSLSGQSTEMSQSYVKDPLSNDVSFGVTKSMSFTEMLLKNNLIDSKKIEEYSLLEAKKTS